MRRQRKEEIGEAGTTSLAVLVLTSVRGRREKMERR